MTISQERPRRRRSWFATFVPAFVLLTAMSGLWALASPIFSSPDENAHGAKAVAQLRGQVIGETVPDVPFIRVDLPDTYRYSPSMLCFVFEPTISANCPGELGAPGGTDWFGTWVGAYNPSYYYLVGWPSLFLDGSSGVYGMRIVSAILCSAFLAIGLTAAFSSQSGRWMAASAVFLASPMVLYMAGSVNPQGIEIASAAALWACLIRLIESYSSRSPVPRAWLWVWVTIAAIVLANARALGPLWLVIIVAASFIFCGWRNVIALFARPINYVAIGLIAASGVFALLWTLLSGNLSGTATASEAPLAGGTFLQGALAMVRLHPRFILEAAGVFGWLDTTLPALVYAVFFISISLLVVLGLTSAGRRGYLAVGGITLLAVVVPVVVQGYSVRQTGLIWQGRYGLFLYLAIPLFAALVLSASRRVAFLSIPWTVIIVVGATTFGIAAFLLALRRYVVGSDSPITQMISAPEWQPPGGWMLLVTAFVLASAAYAAFLVRAAVNAARLDRGMPTEADTRVSAS